jgi:hypothetical protein
MSGVWPSCVSQELKMKGGVVAKMFADAGANSSLLALRS